MEGNSTQLHPSYKEAAQIIAQTGVGEFYSDGELGMLLEAAPGTDEFRLALLNLRNYLLYKHRVDFIRAVQPGEGLEKIKGYKVASPQESLKITTKRLRTKIHRTAKRERTVLKTINRAQLSEDEQDEFDRKITRTGMTIAFLQKTPLSIFTPGVDVGLSVEVPRLMPPEGEEG